MSPSYLELAPPPGLEAFLACGWVSHDGEVRVLPDACVDIVFEGGVLVVAGPATGAVVAPPTPGRPRVGVRFRVGAAGAALGAPAAELLDDQVALSELWGRDARRLEDEVAAAADPAAALAVLTQGVAERLPPPDTADADIRRAALILSRGGVAAAGRAAHLSERQLRRRFERAVGYGPATLARVTRFQRFLALARTTAAPAPRPAGRDKAPAPAPLARLAADAGYADQAHLTRECRRLAGLPPGALLAAGATPAGEPAALPPPKTADPFKRRRSSSGTVAA